MRIKDNFKLIKLFGLLYNNGQFNEKIKNVRVMFLILLLFKKIRFIY